MDEAARVAMLARVLGSEVRAAGVELGIGDDAAVLQVAALGGERLVWTIDEQVEGTHFRREFASWRDIGWRSFMAAASDVAAMGARARAALCALVLPDDLDDAALEAIAMGQRDAADATGAPVIGGNLARGPVLSLATTVLGACSSRAVRRSGGMPGDGLWLAGDVGLAAAGLRAIEKGALGEARLAAAVEAWRRPRARLDDGLAMSAVAHAAVDVSDGLARDVGHMATASGVRIVFDEAALRADTALAAAAAALGVDALELALHGGEDYALVIASPRPVAGFRAIGAVTEGAGLALRSAGAERALEPRGFDHFAAR
jgi:thiamine-monophosphate kinase